jgi:transglutaminase-like putative cysteine protease
VSINLKIFRPLPRSVTRPVMVLVVVAWVVTMAALVNREYLQASSATLATDLARYGPTAVWNGIYYRGEKIGFTVSQTTRTDQGFELQEDGRLQMLLLGQASAATIRTRARVDPDFALRSFDFSLDPGTGAISVHGDVAPPPVPGGSHRLDLSITSSGVTRTETRELPEAPVLSQNLSRLMAVGRLVPGSRHRWTILDPATLRSAPVILTVADRSMVRTGSTIVPAFRVEMDFQGLRTTSWVTDTGDVVREESPLGLMTIRETAERAQGLSVPARLRNDLLAASAVVPQMRQRIDDPRDIRRLSMRLSGVEIDRAEVHGEGQTLDGETIEIVDPRTLRAGPRERDLERFLRPEPLIESDAPEIRAEAEKAIAPPAGVANAPANTTASGVAAAASQRAHAERLTRYVNALLEKKPTVSLPSAVDVLRTKVGDCNEHTALYVAMARSIGIPSRIAVGLVYARGAFYYHAWPEVYLREGDDRGLWLPVDPTFNQFPADATHLRLARGGLDKQAAILPLLGRLEITVLEAELTPGADRVLVGRELESSLASVPFAAPRAASSCGCPEDGR